MHFAGWTEMRAAAPLRRFALVWLVLLVLSGCQKASINSPQAFGEAQLAALKNGDGAALMALRMGPEAAQQWRESYLRLLRSGEVEAAGFDRALATLRTVAELGPSEPFSAALAEVQPLLAQMFKTMTAYFATHIDQDPYLNASQREAKKALSAAIFKQLIADAVLTPENVQQLAKRFVALLDQAGIRSYQDLQRGEDVLAARTTLALALVAATLEVSGLEPGSVLASAQIQTLESGPQHALIATTFSVKGQPLRFTERLIKRTDRWYPAPSIPAKD
jgi:hypothetical protein